MEITENVYQLDSPRFSHVFLIKGSDNVLIDTGMPGGAERMLSEIKELGVSSIRFILLTHHDIDHIGNAARIREAMGAEVWAPENDIPYITGEKKRPGMKRVIQALAKVKKPRITGSLEEHGSFGEVKPVFAPGHTLGHTIFRYRNVVFTGDLFRSESGKMSVTPGCMNWDTEEVKRSISLLKGFEFDWLCPAHGEPVKNGPKVKAFLEEL